VAVDLPPEYERWARLEGLSLVPRRTSRLCGGEGSPPVVTLVEPRDGTRYALDPESTGGHGSVRLRAVVDGDPVTDEVVFLVDGEPVGMAAGPHEVRWSLSPGRHTIQAVLAMGGAASAPIAVTVRR
jgi:penicillin-binding protein 1C